MGVNSSGGKNAISTIISVALHGIAAVLLCISYNTRTKPRELHVMKVSMVRPAPPKPKLQPPKPEPPKPEPPKPEPKPEPPKPEPKPEPPKPEPKPEPPKPQPPKPEPPKPQPPKPEPPKVVKPLPQPQPLKPKPEPSKPEPPKVVKPLPQPQPLKPKPEPSKPEPKPVTPKPQPPKELSLAERLKAAQPVKQPTKPRTNTNDLRQRLNKAIQSQDATQPKTQNSKEVASAGIVVETANYAEQVVRPYIQQNWIQPVRGELDIANPTPVEISFTVYSSGSISDVMITKRSNSKVMNASVEQFIRSLTRLPQPSTIGSNASSLQISVSMVLTN